MIAAAILVFLYLTQTEESTKLSDDNAITTLIISAAYYVASTWSSGYGVIQTDNPVNPAIAIGDAFGILLNGGFQWGTWTWLFFLFPLLGSLLAVLLFEAVFKKAAQVVAEQQHNNDNDGMGGGLLAE